MAKYQHTTLVIPDEHRDRLEEIARELGYLQTRGAGAGQLGSISALVCSIASGDLTIQRRSQLKLSHTDKRD